MPQRLERQRALVNVRMVRRHTPQRDGVDDPERSNAGNRRLEKMPLGRIGRRSPQAHQLGSSVGTADASRPEHNELDLVDKRTHAAALDAGAVRGVCDCAAELNRVDVRQAWQCEARLLHMRVEIAHPHAGLRSDRPRRDVRRQHAIEPSHLQRHVVGDRTRRPRVQRTRWLDRPPRTAHVLDDGEQFVERAGRTNITRGEDVGMAPRRRSVHRRQHAAGRRQIGFAASTGASPPT
jgi:hypothetical protein